MASELIALFPLSFVLLPTMPLPLHIFEDRYKEMMGDLLAGSMLGEEAGERAGSAEFGVVLAKDDGIVNIGCSAVIEKVVNRYPDGRLDLLATGQRRFQIASLDQDKAYLRAEVDYFNDEDAADVSPELNQKASDAYQLLLQMERPDVVEEPRLDRSRMSFRLAQFVYDLDKRQTVLSLRSEVERLEFLVKIMPEYILRQERMALAKRVGPQNGHAKGM